ncbi:MAG: pyruvate kinase [Cyclobacteriaceae bacterium]|nr:pyruvate kinase [Cyclobacteriaceae bacterium]
MTLENLENELTNIYQELLEGEAKADKIASSMDSKYRLSAKNLYRYLILRSRDMRKLHDSLSDLGISSLRTSEGYVYKNVANALKIVKLMQGKDWTDDEKIESIGYIKSKRLLHRHSNILFNSKDRQHSTEIMVTMPDEAAGDLEFLKNLILSGMEIARINLSHGNEEQWLDMVKSLNKVSKALHMPIKIYMDLSGPKIRVADINIERKKGKKTKTVHSVKLRKDDKLILTKRETNGKRARYDSKDRLVEMAEVAVSLPQIIDDIKIGENIFFDDGMIEAKVIEKTSEDAILVITKAHKKKLSAQKGINLPDTHLRLPSLTDRDIELLPFVLEHADIVGYSFVRNADDVEKLYIELDRLKGNDIGIVFKIENQEAFENLPLILFEAMKKTKIGVMIARGDLAVEIGYERISEVQNQILWLCEAAHIPVIWATQVLDNLAKNGVATRAEVSDASISAQAECVMLNKGPYIVEAVKTLKSILTKTESHTTKKKNTMRALHVAKMNLRKLSRPKSL